MKVFRYLFAVIILATGAEAQTANLFPASEILGPAAATLAPGRTAPPHSAKLASPTRGPASTPGSSAVKVALAGPVVPVNPKLALATGVQPDLWAHPIDLLFLFTFGDDSKSVLPAFPRSPSTSRSEPAAVATKAPENPREARHNLVARNSLGGFGSGAAFMPQSGQTPAQGGQPAGSTPTPTNPLQEPPKVTTTGENRPRSTFDVGDNTSAGQDQLLGEVRLSNRYTEVGGDATRSFRVDAHRINSQCPPEAPPGCIVSGFNNLAEFNIFNDHSFGFNHRIQMLFQYRGTDDRSIDPEHNSLQRAYLRFYGPRDEIILGDSLVSFSRLSFNQNIKGVNVTRKIGEHWKLSGVGGIFIDRYGSLYNDLPGRPFMAAIAGARAEYRFLKESTLGFNFSSSSDQVDSLPSARTPLNPTGVGIPPLPAVNNVGTIDTKLQLGGVRTDAEFAYSATNFDRRASNACLAPCDRRLPQPGVGTQSDWGLRVEESYRVKKLSLRASLVRYQPNFTSINARQISDLQDIVFRAGYDLTNWLTVDGTVRRSNNDLKGQLPFETRLWGPEARFIFHDLSFYPRANLEVGYRHRDVQGFTTSSTVPCTPEPAPFTRRCVDRFVRLPYAELTIPVKTTFLTLGYERRGSHDQIDPSQSSNTDRVYASLRGIYDFGGWHLNPSLRYELERQSRRRGPAIVECTVFPFQCLTDRDSNRLALASVFLESPKYFIAELAFRDSSATIFGPAGYSRPSYRAQLSYKIRNDENMMFIFGFERNSNFYQSSPNFDERVWSGTLLYKFGKRAQ